MKHVRSGVNAWEQGRLDSTPILKLVLEVGVLNHDGVALYQVTAIDESLGQTVAMWSSPGRNSQDWEHDLPIAVAELRRLMAAYTEPFPDR